MNSPYRMDSPTKCAQRNKGCKLREPSVWQVRQSMGGVSMSARVVVLEAALL